MNINRSKLRAIDAAILEAITDLGKWGDVVKHIVQASGASKGILALRKTRDAAFKVPSGVLDSPLLFGFSNSEIEEYLSKYIFIDPWTEIEERVFPTFPYALSKYLSIEDLQKLEFWNWLQPQRISDSVVVNVGEFEDYWVGLNLFFDGDDDTLRQQTIALLNELLPNLKRAWNISEIHRMASQQTGVTLREIAFIPLSAFFCKPNGQTNMATDQLRAFQKAEPDLIRNIEPCVNFDSRHHQIEFNKLLKQVERDGGVSSTNLEFGEADIVLSISRVTEAEDVLGRQTAQFLCVLDHPVFNNRSRLEALVASVELSERERQMLDYLKDPKSTISGFANHIGKTGHAADFHWRNLKGKLGVSNLRELRLLFNRQH